jgi:integrase
MTAIQPSKPAFLIENQNNRTENKTAHAIGVLANEISSLAIFADYQKLKSENTLVAQHRDLRLFGNFINQIYDKADGSEMQVPFRLGAGQLYRDPAGWETVTHGLVRLFKTHLENDGRALTAINRVLSTVRKYADLATSAGKIDPVDNLMIQNVKGYLGSEARNVDAKRQVTRKSGEKEQAVPIPKHIIVELKAKETFSDGVIGKRNRVILCFCLDHGLRASEIAGLRIDDIDLEEEVFRVYRQKTNTSDLLALTADTTDALLEYLKLELPLLPSPDTNLLLRAVHGKGVLREKSMSRTTISQTVNKYGKMMAIKHAIPSLEKLSSHDGRHQWATDVLRSGAGIDQLQQAGGWKSPSMPLRYVNKRKIANDGIKLDR